MASFFPRRRRLCLKTVIFIPLVWFFAVFVLNYDPSSEPGMALDDGDDPNPEVLRKPRLDDSSKLPTNPDRKTQGERLELGGAFGNAAENEDGTRREKDGRRWRTRNKNEEEERKRMEEERKREKKEEEEEKKALKFKSEKTRARKLDPAGPGEQGNGVRVNMEKLTPQERREYEEGWQRNAYNQYVSDRISVHRSLPDVRDPEWTPR